MSLEEGAKAVELAWAVEARDGVRNVVVTARYVDGRDRDIQHHGQGAETAEDPYSCRRGRSALVEDGFSGGVVSDDKHLYTLERRSPAKDRGHGDGELLDVDVRGGKGGEVCGPGCIIPVIEAEGSAGKFTGITVYGDGGAVVPDAAAVGGDVETEEPPVEISSNGGCAAFVIRGVEGREVVKEGADVETAPGKD